MKKVALITHHRSYNYGAVLQTIASVEYLKSLGFDVEVIDYYPDYLLGFGTFKKTLNDASIVNKGIIKRLLLAVIKTPNFKRIKQRFDTMIDNSYPLTKPYSSTEQLISDPPVADIYCTGSDQVWNNYYTKKFEDPYFLSFVSERCPCVSLAASFGKDNFTQDEIDYLKNKLEKYNYVSVRESNGVNICQNMGIHAELMLDPTLMVSPSFWKQFASSSKVEKNFILVYQLHGDSNIIPLAQRLKDESGLSIVRITTTNYQYSQGCKNILLPNLNNFVSLFQHASYVLTDSFHGTVFSLLFEKKVGVIRPKRFGNRIDSLLTMLNANDFVLKDYTAWNNIKFEERYPHINSRLEHIRRVKNSQFYSAIRFVMNEDN